MANTTFLTVIDEGLRARLYYKFMEDLGLTNLAEETAFFPREVAMRIIAETRGRVAMEFLNVWRESTNIDWNRQRTSTATRGFLLEFTDAGKTDIGRSYAVPVDLRYSFWAWSKDPEKLNKVTERYLFWQHRDPNLDLVYNDQYPVELDLHFDNVVHESPVENMYEGGLYYVNRYPITVDGWVFLDDTVKTVHKVIISVYYRESQAQDVLLFREEYTLTGES